MYARSGVERGAKVTSAKAVKIQKFHAIVTCDSRKMCTRIRERGAYLDHGPLVYYISGSIRKGELTEFAVNVVCQSTHRLLQSAWR